MQHAPAKECRSTQRHQVAQSRQSSFALQGLPLLFSTWRREPVLVVLGCYLEFATVSDPLWHKSEVEGAVAISMLTNFKSFEHSPVTNWIGNLVLPQHMFSVLPSGQHDQRHDSNALQNKG